MVRRELTVGMGMVGRTVRGIPMSVYCIAPEGGVFVDGAVLWEKIERYADLSFCPDPSERDEFVVVRDEIRALLGLPPLTDHD